MGQRLLRETIAAIQEADAAYRRAFDRRAAGYAKLHADFGYDYDADEWALPELELNREWTVAEGDLCFHGQAGGYSIEGMVAGRVERDGYVGLKVMTQEGAGEMFPTLIVVRKDMER